VPAVVPSDRTISTRTLPSVAVTESKLTDTPTSCDRRVAGVLTAAIVFAVLAVSETFVCVVIV
jgi:hypothetical protein